MKRGTTKHSAVGRRVEIPAYAATWMRGARFGTVERVIPPSGNYIDPKDPRGMGIFFVRLDHPQASAKCFAYPMDDCRYLESLS